MAEGWKADDEGQEDEDVPDDDDGEPPEVREAVPEGPSPVGRSGDDGEGQDGTMARDAASGRELPSRRKRAAPESGAGPQA